MTPILGWHRSTVPRILQAGIHSIAEGISNRVPVIVVINLIAALATWWPGWPRLQWLAWTMAALTACATILIVADFWTSPLPWRSMEQRGFGRKRDALLHSIRYNLIDETISERTIPLGCSAMIVIFFTGFLATGSNWLGIATFVLIICWSRVLAEKEQWPLVEPSDSDNRDSA